MLQGEPVESSAKHAKVNSEISPTGKKSQLVAVSSIPVLPASNGVLNAGGGDAI